jgi:HK97 family phage prohead protease
VVLSEQLFRSSESINLLKGGNDLIVAGYASVELVDKQGDIITRGALKDAFRKFMEDPKYRNVQLAHSNIQVGEVIPNYTDSEGRLWKSEVDDVGMFVVVQLRNDIEKAKEVSAEIRKGSLRGFSIGGQAFKRMRKSDPKRGDYQEISKLELHEITICEKGINPEATFSILKEDKGEKNMTEENDDDMMKQMSDVLTRLEGRLDSMEKGMPEGLKEHMESKKDSKDEAKDDKEKAYMKGDDEKKDEDDKKKSEEFSDVITSDYLNWMEDTLKSGGVDIDAARAHFDDVNKANLGSTPESIGDGADYFGGQVKGRAQENGAPSTNAIARTTGSGGKKEVKKSDYLDPSLVNEADVEAAYEVYKAAAAEQDYRATLEKQFASRYAQEREEEIAKAEAAAYDARGPLAEIQKSIEALSERIDSATTSPEVGETIAKSDAPSVSVPSTEDLARMSWSEVHNLATRAFNPE